MKEYTTGEKVKIQKDLFRGSPTVVPKTWTAKDGKTGFAPMCSNRGVPNMCAHVDGKTCNDCTNKKYKPWNDTMRIHHLNSDEKDGKDNIIEYGVYPLLEDGVSCYFVAADFDDRPFSDVKKLHDKLKEWGFEPTIFRSKSKGWHVYIFFSEPVEAKYARAIMRECFKQLGMCPSGDGGKMPELFPKQDSTSAFGNLIRLPMSEHRLKDERCCPVNENDIPVGEEVSAI